MISHKQKLIARQVFIDILRRLFARKVRARLPVLSKRLVTQREKSRITGFKTRPANFTLSKMIARRQQFRGAEPILRVVLNLFLSQVFHWFSI